MDYIKELFCGNLSPANQKIVKSSEYYRITTSCGKLYDELKGKLSEEDCKTLEEFSGAHFEAEALTAEEYYALGFRDGARLMLDVLLGKNKNVMPICE